MAALLSAPSLVHSRCPAPRRLAAAPAAQRRLRRRRAAGPVAAQKQQQQQPISEADLYHSVSGAPLAPPRRAGLAGQPLYVTVPLAFAGLIAVLRTAKFLKKRMGSDRLAERGFKKGGVADDRAYTRAIRGMRKMEFEELSEEQIQAARRRRQREVAKDMAPLDLDQIELPENHPFAVKKKLAPEEEALQASRMHARRGLSAEDMRKLREQQALAEQMEAEEEARQAARRRQG